MLLYRNKIDSVIFFTYSKVHTSITCVDFHYQTHQNITTRQNFPLTIKRTKLKINENITNMKNVYLWNIILHYWFIDLWHFTGINYTMMQHCVPEDQTSQTHYCGNLHFKLDWEIPLPYIYGFLYYIYHKVISFFNYHVLELIYLLRLTAFTRHTNLPNWNSKTLTPRLFSHTQVYISSPLKS